MSVAKSSWEKGHALLEAYDGPYVIESLHPGAVNWYKEHHPEVCRGQLSWPAKLSKNGAAEWVAGLLAFDWLSRPDFVAYDWTGGASPQVRLARSMGAMPVSWAVRSSDELAQYAPTSTATSSKRSAPTQCEVEGVIDVPMGRLLAHRAVTCPWGGLKNM